MTQFHRQYAEGCMLGLACGDALGTTLEFTTPRGLPSYPELVSGPHRDVEGGGPFKVAKGQVTDDTMMAVALARSLRQADGFMPAHIANEYQAWRRVTFDIGSTTSGALERIARGVPATVGGQATWESSQANGSLMRCAPIGVYYATHPHLIAHTAAAESAITHSNPHCMLACAAFCAAIGAAVRDDRGEGKSELEQRRVAMLEAAMNAIDDVADTCKSRDDERFVEHLHQASEAIREDVMVGVRGPSPVDDGRFDMHKYQGFVRVALRLAFYHLLRTDSFESALIDVVNRGGDADTNGAIVGALLGALHGIYAIPLQWRKAVIEARASSSFSDDQRDAFDHRFHPRRILEFVTAVELKEWDVR